MITVAAILATLRALESVRPGSTDAEWVAWQQGGTWTIDS